MPTLSLSLKRQLLISSASFRGALRHDAFRDAAHRAQFDAWRARRTREARAGHAARTSLAEREARRDSECAALAARGYEYDSGAGGFSLRQAAGSSSL